MQSRPAPHLLVSLILLSACGTPSDTTDTIDLNTWDFDVVLVAE